MKIVLAGHVCIDVNTSEHASYTGWGSPLMYMAHYMRQHLDIDPTLLAPYGYDFLPYVDGLTLLPEPAGEATMVYRNHTHDHHRIQYCEHIDTANPVALTTELAQLVAEADIICVAPLLPNYPAAYLRELLARRKPDSIAVLSPQGYMRSIDAEGLILPRAFKDYADVVPLFDMMVLSEDDVPDAFDTARLWAAAAPETDIVVTQGPGGASVVRADGVLHVATDPVDEENIIDSVGCGDVFTAAAMYNYCQTRDIAAAVAAGNRAAHDKLFHTTTEE